MQNTPRNSLGFTRSCLFPLPATTGLGLESCFSDTFPFRNAAPAKHRNLNKILLRLVRQSGKTPSSRTSPSGDPRHDCNLDHATAALLPRRRHIMNRFFLAANARVASGRDTGANHPRTAWTSASSPPQPISTELVAHSAPRFSFRCFCIPRTQKR